MLEMKGFKAVDLDYRPRQDRALVYRVGETYAVGGEIWPCVWGLHFCPELLSVYAYYEATYCTRVFKVTASGQVMFRGDKCVTDKLHIDTEMCPHEIIDELVKGADAGSDHDYCAYGSVMKALMYSLLYNDNPQGEERLLRRQWMLAMQAHEAEMLVQYSASATGYDLYELVQPIDEEPAL